MMSKLVSDEIPNIRFNVAKSYAVLMNVLKRLPSEGSILQLEKSGAIHNATPSPRGQEVIQREIIPNLEKLQHDEDVDVRYFAGAAMGTMNEEENSTMHQSP